MSDARKKFMMRAIALSSKAVRTNQGGPFGAVVVRKGKIVGEGWNQVTSANDPTAHAEMVAIRSAAARLKTFRLKECALYASCEPCPMCLAAIYWARIRKVYYANTKSDAAVIGFDDARIYKEIQKSPGRRKLKLRQILLIEALNPFLEWYWKRDKIPY